MKLLKFSNKIEYLEDLQQGKLFMNGINYFRKLEKEEQGDKNDGILCIDNTLLTIENKDETFTFKTSECKIALTENYPIFCMSAIEDDLFKYTSL